MDIASYPNANFVDDMYLSKLRSGETTMSSTASIHRYVIPLVSASDVKANVNLVGIKSEARSIRVDNWIILEPEVLSESGLELPTINKKFCGRKYSYFYAVLNSNSLCKVDVKKQEIVTWSENQFTHPGKMIFLPNPEGSGEEDDGILLSAVSDSREDASDFLLFLNAKDFTEIARAKLEPGVHIPQALHGIFIKE